MINEDKKQSKEIKGFNSKTLTFKEALFFLHLLYKKLLEILDAFTGGYLNIRNPNLNHVYTICHYFIEEICKREDLQNLSKEKPDFFESLIEDIKETDIEWEFISKQAYGFLGKIEKMYILEGSPKIKIPIGLQKALKRIDEIIIDHKEYDKKGFDHAVREIEKIQSPSVPKPKINLSSQKIEFSNDKGVIKIGIENIQLPPYKNEHYFCRTMFKQPKNKFMSWDEIYQEITGEDPFNEPLNKNGWRVVYDAMESLNKRIKKNINTDEKLFIWKEKMVMRMY